MTCSAGSRRSPASTSSPPSTSTRPGRTARSTSQALEALPLGPEPRGVHRPLRHARRRHGTGPRHPQATSGPTAAEQAQMERMLAEALRGRLRRDVFAATALRQARRRRLPLAHPAVDVRQAARTAPAEVDAAAPRTDPAVGPRHSESAQPRLAAGAVAGHLPQAAQDQPAVGGRRQGQPVRDQDDGPGGAADQPARRQLPLAAPAGAVRGLRRRHRPGDLRGVRRGRRRAAPARRGRAQRADARRGVPPRSSARTTRASSACGCGTATSSTPRSSTARTRR